MCRLNTLLNKREGQKEKAKKKRRKIITDALTLVTMTQRHYRGRMIGKKNEKREKKIKGNQK